MDTSSWPTSRSPTFRKVTHLSLLAHEIGHVVSDHWQQMGGLYRRWIPGEVTPSQTEPVAGSLGR